MVDAGAERQIAIIIKVDTHIRKTDLSVVYTNDPIAMENSINTLEQLLAEDDNTKWSVQGQGGEKKKQKDSLVYLAAAIIDPYYTYMKAEFDKDKSVWHKACVKELDEEHIKYVAKDTYTSYEMYRRIVDMRKCLLPADGEG
ncbi:putative ubiquitin-conjugating enzyme E2 26 [Hordeum vulgare]|nr:putative ubiquitin-conjugating enzyme E2 26 [Hordeum vulgare]